MTQILIKRYKSIGLLCSRIRCYSQSVGQHLKSFPNVYNQREVEQFWTDIWKKHKLYQTSSSGDDSKSFRMLLPPPNITGNLHLGHSLTVAIQDALCRYNRMNGREVAWYGGTDHAGIATQMLVEKMIWKKYQKSRHDMSKEEFATFFEEWKNEKNLNIQSQLEALGASIDFSSNYFTLSPEMSNFVQDVFIELFNRDLIYRASYMVNWSYYLQSTLSDIEISHKFISKPTIMTVPGCSEPFQVGVLHHFKYPVHESSEFLEIATTRIESVMGDVGVAVNPEDARYAHLIGGHAHNPFTGQLMPIVGDAAVKMDFGTGVLKLTPAHCLADYELATKHQLPLDLVVFDERGFIKCAYEPLNGLHRCAAKSRVIDELVKRDLYVGVRDHAHWLPLCSRSGDIIEDKQVPQWFLKADDARAATEFVVNRDNLSDGAKEKWASLSGTLPPRERNISVIPSGYRNTWRDWFSRYKDWCISRQISWGHQIPAYEVLDRATGASIRWIAAKSLEEARQIAQTAHALKLDTVDFRRDPDVLDTWFSSALLPLSVSPDRPLSLMETGHDILFFWVARMVLMSVLLRGGLPFERILLHGMICDEKGAKMSKSKGNVVDPMHLIRGAKVDDLIAQHKSQLDSGVISDKIFTDKLQHLLRALPKGIEVCGADILRLSLLQSDFKEQKVNFNLQKTLQRRSFVNKMHQTVRFILLQFDASPAQGQSELLLNDLPTVDELSNVDKWILTRLATLINVAHESFESYDLQEAARHIEAFWTNDLCDVYLESFKFSRHSKSLALLVDIVMRTLQVMHPFMPFITENLFQHLQARISKQTDTFSSILESRYPRIEESPLLKALDPATCADFEQVFSIVRKIRWFKQHFHINREPEIVQKIYIASLNPRLPDFRRDIEANIKIDGCELEFVSLHDIYSYENCYCFDVKDKQDASRDAQEGQETVENKNSLQSDEIFVLFDVQVDRLKARLESPKLSLKVTKIADLVEEINNQHSSRFTENFKRLTRIVV